MVKMEEKATAQSAELWGQIDQIQAKLRCVMEQVDQRMEAAKTRESELSSRSDSFAAVSGMKKRTGHTERPLRGLGGEIAALQYTHHGSKGRP